MPIILRFPLSQAFLTYHLKSSSCSHILPPTWSSAVDDFPYLLGTVQCLSYSIRVTSTSFDGLTCGIYIHHTEILCLNEAIGIANQILREETIESPVLYKKCEDICGVYNVLLLETDWVRSNGAHFFSKVVATLNSIMVKTSIDVNEALIKNAMLSVLEILSSHSACDRTSLRNLWLIKPVGLSCGDKIYVKNKISDIIEIVTGEMGYKCVVQKYIERPLLVRDGKKFDIRQWVLITSVNPLIVYGFSQFYLRLSSQPYSTEELNLGNNFIHLTNNTIQKASPFSSTTCDDPMYHPLMMTENEFSGIVNSRAEEFSGDAELSSHKAPHEFYIKDKIKEISVQSIVAVRDRLEKVGRGYEWLGFDFMISDNLDVKLIEINTSPDMTYSTPITEVLVKAATHDLLNLVLEEGLTANDIIKRTLGARVPKDDFGEFKYDTEGLSDLKTAKWNLWHVMPLEPKNSIKSQSARKVETLGNLDTEHKPKSADCVTAVMSGILHGFPGTEGVATICEDEEDEL